MTSGGNEPLTTIERLSAQGLSGSPFGNSDDVVGRLLAVQAQDARGSRLTIRSRTQGLSAADVDSAFNDGSMVITWLNRGTLHLIRSKDYAWLHEVTAPRQVNFNLRRLEQEGVSPDQAEGRGGHPDRDRRSRAANSSRAPFGSRRGRCPDRGAGLHPRTHVLLAAGPDRTWSHEGRGAAVRARRRVAR